MYFEAVAYDHAAKLINQSPYAVSRSADLLAQAQIASQQLYGNRDVVIGLDVYNVEAEVYGCTIIEPEPGAVPTPQSTVFDECEDLLDCELDPTASGRVPLLFNAARQVQKALPDCSIFIAIAGPVSIASHLVGTENLLCDLFTDTADTIEVLQHLANNQALIAKHASDEGFGVTLFESMVTPPLVAPELFNQHIAPILQSILQDHNNQLIIGGNTEAIIPGLIASGARNLICPVECDQTLFMTTMNNRVRTRVNLPPQVFLPGQEEDAMAAAHRVAEICIAHQCAFPGVLLPGNADPKIVTQITEYFSQH